MRTFIVRQFILIIRGSNFYSTRATLSDLSIDAQEYKVFPGTEQKIYHDAFFQAQNIVVNALDNVEARRYVDR